MVGLHRQAETRSRQRQRAEALKEPCGLLAWPQRPQHQPKARQAKKRVKDRRKGEAANRHVPTRHGQQRRSEQRHVAPPQQPVRQPVERQDGQRTSDRRYHAHGPKLDAEEAERRRERIQPQGRHVDPFRSDVDRAEGRLFQHTQSQQTVARLVTPQPKRERVE